MLEAHNSTSMTKPKPHQHTKSAPAPNTTSDADTQPSMSAPPPKTNNLHIPPYFEADPFTLEELGLCKCPSRIIRAILRNWPHPDARQVIPWKEISMLSVKQARSQLSLVFLFFIYL